MLLGALFFLAVCSAGFGALRLLGLSKGLLGLGLAPAAGVAVLAVLTSWSTLLGMPAFVRTLLFCGAVLTGLFLATRDRAALRTALAGAHRLALAVLLVSVVGTALVLATAFGSVAVPLGGHDGAHHLELVTMLRQGGQWFSTYPLGFHAMAAAFLQPLPTSDLTQPLFDTSLGLGLLAPMAAFGLGYAVWRNALAAACGALLVSLTFQYPYQPYFWSGWPLAAGILLSLGLWTTALEYLRRPSMRTALLAGILAGGILLVHGTEVYTSLVGLVVILAASLRQVPWRRLPRDVGAAAVLAIVVTGPYVATLVGWAHSGGAIAVGYDALDLPTMTQARSDLSGEMVLWLDTFGALVADAPVRAILVVAGVSWAFRHRTGRLLAPLSLAFAALALAFTYLDNPLVQRVFALTYPWGLRYRLVMLTSLGLNLLGGAGLAYLVYPWLRACWSATAGHRTAWQRLGRAAGALGLVVLGGSAALLPLRLSTTTLTFETYSADDAKAMGWLRAHAQPGEVLANDGPRDAGIWAPYKAHVPVLLPRALPVSDLDERELVLANVGHLEQAPEARAAACALGVRYVYRGAAGTGWEAQKFPSAAVLQRSSALEEVFSSGDAALFALRCAS